ncbi:MAG TPA: DnaJ domain-containing protein, partial [Stenomitos sp.]
MQISLDFYRILGVPTRATPEQLQQAFEDRLQQLPRQEYSSAAIATRKQLLEEAFVVLADPEKRKAYDQSWTEDPETESPPEAKPPQTLEIVDGKLAGVLLLLQEVGDYQQILDLGANYLQRPIDLNRVPTQAGTSEEDVILAMALANLELGRDQWQQSQFEAAAGSLQAGLDLLTQEQHFPDVQADIRSDLYKLRPYRILELLNGSEPEAEARSKGLSLLQSMLDDRDGIDGNQDDQSGLSVNDFLRFIQQLREYLTVSEQQELFEREATRPSAVASYLAVYALIARGVSSGKPELVERA